jgi:hypothetical protein
MYLEDMKEDTTKTNRGFDVNRAFYLVSRMPMRRVARTDSNNVTIMQWRSNDGYTKQQQFFFD